MTNVNLTAQPVKAIRALVQAGVVTREDALAHVKANIKRYAAKGARPTKIARWTRLADELAGKPAQEQPKAAPKAKAKAKAEAKPKAPMAHTHANAMAAAYSAAVQPEPKKPMTRTQARKRVQALMSKRILSNTERAEINAIMNTL